MLKVVRHPPYQGGQGGSNPKSIFNLIITTYLILFKISCCTQPSTFLFLSNSKYCKAFSLSRI
ncbi:MAG: hypothetical protein EWV49_18155 [Microcystis aeruginosa Ma_QC_Ch_20071001_S25]|uniref:Uncharacterized protein n=1 Tax=Microcystis aeruginosa Ma_QC_Ch_20071001_S25D TaxID=2486250 RepID=A0A552FK65_MICAE|nr:MAG: hypothetical protein EWV49_18155 [Microcystis aeruginosa Ma_QC_Ch_20071001_S25]TRU47093.1 MAG: hypothetical protein EWV57_17285 [Microcystis aeruginosa Ma_QC_Ch_20071001_S25D]TRU57268.1 MAG: hypothetical protein EWV90_21085 [Microcystis aeruginosa Ma_QC_Ch_20071001_M135]